MTTTFSINDLRRKETMPKIADPGIYSRLKLTKAEKDDDKFKYTFELSDGSAYTDTAIFYKPNSSYTKSVEDQQKAMIEKIIEIADAVGNPMELAKLPPSATYINLMETIHRYIESKVNFGIVNMKIVLDKDGDYANPAAFGFIEKWTEGATPKLRFSNWEIDNKRSERVGPRPERKKDDTVAPGESAPALTNTVNVDGVDLPF